MNVEKRLHKLISELKNEDPSILEEALNELGPEKFLVRYLLEAVR